MATWQAGKSPKKIGRGFFGWLGRSPPMGHCAPCHVWLPDGFPYIYIYPLVRSHQASNPHFSCVRTEKSWLVVWLPRLIFLCGVYPMPPTIINLFWEWFIQLMVTGWCFGTSIVFYHINWECHHPNWRTHIFQRGEKNHQPGKKCLHILDRLKGGNVLRFIIHVSWSQGSAPVMFVCKPHEPVRYMEGFSKSRYPQIIHFNGSFPSKPSILGYPPFMESTISIIDFDIFPICSVDFQYISIDFDIYVPCFPINKPLP